MPKLPVTIRAAKHEDMASVAGIHQHYVLNTVATFSMDVLSVQDHVANLEKVQSQDLPYLIAETEAGKIVGFSYLSGFRGEKQAIDTPWS